MGKSAVNALGEYATAPMDSALAKTGSSGQHNVEVGAFVNPSRIAVFDDLATPKGGVSPEFLKRVSGDGYITYRALHSLPRSVKATATIFFVANPHTIPRFALEDDALADRVRELEYPKVPVVDQQFKKRIENTDFLEAFLAKLIKEASKAIPGSPPDDIPSVADATAARIAADIGDIGEFAKLVVPTEGRSLTVADAWQAWCRYNDAPTDAPNVGGLTKQRTFGARLEAVLPDLPNRTAVYGNNGKRAKGWKGWALRD